MEQKSIAIIKSCSSERVSLMLGSTAWTTCRAQTPVTTLHQTTKKHLNLSLALFPSVHFISSHTGQRQAGGKSATGQELIGSYRWVSCTVFMQRYAVATVP